MISDCNNVNEFRFGEHLNNAWIIVKLLLFMLFLRSVYWVRKWLFWSLIPAATLPGNQAITIWFWYYENRHSEAATGGVLYKKLFLKIL